MATSTQEMVRPSKCLDVYYYDEETSTRQCFPTTVNTKYVQQFQNLTGGSSAFVIPPQNGIQDVVCQFVIAGLAGGAGNGLALPRGWGYSLVKQASFRYGGSSTYFLTGDQLLQAALRRQPSQQTASQLLSIGGDQLSEAELEGTDAISNVVLTLPHSTPSGVGKAHPFPTDLLTQQVQVTVELNSVSSIFSNNGGTAPTTLKSAQFQVQQVMLNNQGDALARRVDMAENAYAFPAEFNQQVQRINLLKTDGSEEELVATGFRSGEVKSLECWLTRASDNTGNTKNPLTWYLPKSIQMTYAGEIYARFDNGSSLIWNLINGNKATVVDTIDLTWNGSAYVADPILSYWVSLPFSQTMIDEDAHSTLIHGKPITNGICNLRVQPPAAANDWVLNVSYVYNTTLLFSQGTVDFVF